MIVESACKLCLMQLNGNLLVGYCSAAGLYEILLLFEGQYESSARLRFILPLLVSKFVH